MIDPADYSPIIHLPRLAGFIGKKGSMATQASSESQNPADITDLPPSYRE